MKLKLLTSLMALLIGTSCAIPVNGKQTPQPAKLGSSFQEVLIGSTKIEMPAAPDVFSAITGGEFTQLPPSTPDLKIFGSEKVTSDGVPLDFEYRYSSAGKNLVYFFSISVDGDICVPIVKSAETVGAERQILPLSHPQPGGGGAAVVYKRQLDSGRLLIFARSTNAACIESIRLMGPPPDVRGLRLGG